MSTPRENQSRPLLVILTSHWVSMLGVALVTLAGFAWIFVLPANLRGRVDNPYTGLLVFIAIPAVFLAGLAMIPIGIALGRGRLNEQLATLPDRRVLWRRAGLFFSVMTVVNLVVASQGTYRAVDYMDGVQFCGQACHVMKPEFTAHQLPSHQKVACASCHIAPGATGWFQAKISGTHQLISVIANSFPRPLESAMENNRLVSSSETCEQCHARGKNLGSKLRVLTSYKDDRANGRTQTVLMMTIGGATSGIHGAHMGPGVSIRYAAQDKKRQTIPWVQYRNGNTGQTRTYLAMGSKEEAVKKLPVFEMQCVDCHNRPAHSFATPDKAVDEALAEGLIAADLPFVKKTGMALLKAEYRNEGEAGAKISAGLAAFYTGQYAEVARRRAAAIEAAGKALAEIYAHNVFPDLKVTWGTYPNNLGHNDYPGCFRCHDDGHVSGDKKTITQDCDKCHKALATDEAAPAILKSLGWGDVR